MVDVFTTCCSSAPAIRRVRFWPRPSSTKRARAISRLQRRKPSQGRVNPYALDLLRKWATTSALALENLGRICQSGCPRSRFRFHRLRQRGRRNLPGVARPADHRALGHSRSGRRKGCRQKLRWHSRTHTGCSFSASGYSPRYRSAASTNSRYKQNSEKLVEWKMHGLKPELTSCPRTIQFPNVQRARLIMSTFERYLTIWVAVHHCWHCAWAHYSPRISHHWVCRDR